MSLRGGRDEEEGEERGLMEEEEGELDLDGIDLSPEELAMLDKMFQVRVTSHLGENSKIHIVLNKGHALILGWNTTST